MGVKGLWRLLLPIGRRISVETLEGKVLAIDASIWLTQFLKAMRDPETGSVKPAAHLIGFFRRLAKLRYHGIRPVLVFDGATPEIKKREVQQRRQRREQFASTGQGSMHRLAKRLLLEQLKKTKTIKNGTENDGGGAYAAGFQPAEEDQVEAPKDQNHAEEEPSKKPAAKEDDSHEAIMAEVAGLEEQWAIQASLETENDWDNAVIDVTSEEKQSSVYNHTHDVFDVKRISSLPSHERKDAVEEAKRQQRMRSRREFMPVAGQPEEYSQAQVRNFLRSSKLNKEINKMAKKAAGNDDGVGERMASDATRRIVLTRDDDREKSESQWKRLKKRALAFRANPLPHEEEDDEEFEWEDGETTTAKSAFVNVVKDKSSMEISASSRASAVFAAEDSNDDDPEVGGSGFMTSETAQPKATKSAPVIELDSDESDVAEGGGFMTAAHASKSAATFKGVVDIDDDDDEGGGGFLPQPLADARHAQELEDQLLARALQDAESESTATMAAARVPRHSEQESGEYSKEMIAQVDRDAALAAQLQKAEIINGQNDLEADEEDSDAIDWEDGDQDLGLKQDEDSDKKLAGVPRATGPLSVSAALPSRRDMDVEESESDDIAWEDGDDEGTSSDPKTSDAATRFDLPASASCETVARKQTSLRKPIGSTIAKRKPTTQSHSQSSWEDEREANKTGIEANDFDDVLIVDQNAEALQHAQETASHLTNWAGRAFRRAMAQHAEDTGAGSPEKADQDVVMEKETADDSDNASIVETLGDEPESPPTQKQAPVASTTTRTPPTASNASTHNPDRQNPSIVASGGDNTASAQPFGLFQDTSLSLQEQGDILDAEARRQERDMDTITDEMRAEVIQLIQLFGIPYVESPAEAEAQCAKLEELGLVDGIVTEDSDVFVFGGNSIYKNIFDDQKYVEAYLASDAERDLKLNRNQFVALAMLLGGDYSEGVKGVGIVNGMEVLQAFDCSGSVKDGLSKFRAWMDGFDPDDARKTKGTSNEDLTAEQKFRRKHKTARTQWIAPKNFPADNVMNAYLKPVVDTSSDRFSWGTPDLDRLLLFCQRNMGWEHNETRKLLEPVIQRLEDSSRQTRLESFFMRYEDDIKFANVKSKRLRAVFEDIQKDKSSEEKDVPKKKRARSKS